MLQEFFFQLDKKSDRFDTVTPVTSMLGIGCYQGHVNCVWMHAGENKRSVNFTWGEPESNLGLGFSLSILIKITPLPIYR